MQVYQMNSIQTRQIELSMLEWVDQANVHHLELEVVTDARDQCT